MGGDEARATKLQTTGMAQTAVRRVVMNQRFITSAYEAIDCRQLVGFLVEGGANRLDHPRIAC